MKKALLQLGLSFVSLSLCHAANIAVWTFEAPNTPPTVSGPALSGLPSDFGGGTLSGVHADASTTFTSTVGNGSAYGLTANNWQIGDYWQFQVSTLGYAHIGLSFDATASYNGPTNCALAYSLDGASFTTFNDNVNVVTSFGGWNAGTANPVYTTAFDLSSVTALDNASTVYLRFIANLPPWAMGSQSLDNVAISGTAIPEPTNLLLVGAATVCVGLRRRNRRSGPH